MATFPTGRSLGHWGALLSYFTDEKPGGEGSGPEPSQIQTGEWVLGKRTVAKHQALSQGSTCPAMSGPYSSQSCLVG